MLPINLEHSTEHNMDNKSFRNLVESINNIEEGKPAQLKGSDSLKGKDRPGKKAAVGDKLFGEEEDYGFLSKFIPEEEVEEDLVTSMKREMNDYMKDRKSIKEEPKEFSKKGTRARKPKAKSSWSKEDPKLMDSEQVQEYIDHDQLDQNMGRESRKGMKDPFGVEKFGSDVKGMAKKFWGGSKEERFQDLDKMVQKLLDVGLSRSDAITAAKTMIGESLKESDDWNSKKFGAAVKRDQSSRVKAIRKAKSWMKRTGKSAAEAAKEFDINAKDLKEASPEKSQGRRDAGSYGRPGSEQQKKAASKSTRKFGQNQIDAEMSDMNATDDITNPNQGAEGPYAIVWHGQSHEWYGDDTPESGVGRYKPKGDAGNILAINVPSYEEAQKVLSRVEHLAADQGKWGVDGGVVHSDGAEIVSMKELGDHFQGYREGSYYSNKEDSHHQNMIDFTADNA